VDSLWDAPIQKILLKRFPMATPEELEEAHGYAYGGCIIQDMGYYPFSNKLFSDLTHYVRSGDFVLALINESQDLDEYAFALGALAHYAADISGHGLGVNPSVPILYPELRTRFGAIVTYWDNPLSHVRTEFGFDVLQVAEGRYASDKYRKFIGFKVAKPALERAFSDTYGLEIKDLFGGHLDLALGTFRYTTSSLIPEMTRLAWQLRSETIVKETPGTTRRKFLFNLSRSSYEKDWGRDYQRPGVRARLLSFVLRMVPKSGPFKGLAFRAPDQQVEAMFMKSFNTTIDQYRAMLVSESTDRLELPNKDFDTGALTVAGEYKGADLAYDKLLGKLADKKFVGVSAELRDNILSYYDARKPPFAGLLAEDTTEKRAAKQDARARADWQKITAELEQLRQFQIAVVAAQ
jgi:Zinc dependent phospholipase C